MRLFFRENPVDYTQYAFPYQVFAEKEAEDSIESIYEQGFLPASNNLSEPRELFYLARSLRLEIRHLTLDKKRRYLQRRGTEAGLKSHFIPLKELVKRHPDWQEIAIEWVAARYQPPYMTSARLHYLLNRSFLKDAFVTYSEDKLVGIALLPQTSRIAHYWFVFYDSTWKPDLSLGKWILGDCASFCKEEKVDHLYLGTCYTKKASYKFQGIASGVEFFDGSAWSNSTEKLQSLLAADSDPKD